MHISAQHTGHTWRWQKYVPYLSLSHTTPTRAALSSSLELSRAIPRLGSSAKKKKHRQKDSERLIGKQTLYLHVTSCHYVCVHRFIGVFDLIGCALACVYPLNIHALRARQEGYTIHVVPDASFKTVSIFRWKDSQRFVPFFFVLQEGCTRGSLFRCFYMYFPLLRFFPFFFVLRER